VTEPTDIEVPAPRDGEATALPEWIHRPYWSTAQACTYVAAVRGITEESARRWLNRHVVAEEWRTGDGQNVYSAHHVKRGAPVNADGTLGTDVVPAAELYHD
jgi:hypothetical protein